MILVFGLMLFIISLVLVIWGLWVIWQSLTSKKIILTVVTAAYMLPKNGKGYKPGIKNPGLLIRLGSLLFGALQIITGLVSLNAALKIFSSIFI